ncbi:heterokaryon incompatibility protein-domain-containing protein [Elsinoe ampelina]|uniref:Heterokaryon incompatibility protein-domain-containing protein n=1 Tax=Elsinoe ampelina TaxID=302913 RepID=A0A6A6G984_9PEZI|nr:heterokaryon incompatibility protein-domain-containing protein [Elsinoe ampelina]
MDNDLDGVSTSEHDPDMPDDPQANAVHFAVPLQNLVDSFQDHAPKVNGVLATRNETTNVQHDRPSLTAPAPAPQALCSTCESLNLTPDKFFVSSTSRGKPNDHKDFARCDHIKKDMSTLRSIFERSETCPLCYLICRSINTSDLSSFASILDRFASATCWLNWELDGRRGILDRSASRTRRIHIRWSHPGLDDAYLLFAAKKRPLQTNSDSRQTWRTEDYFLGRERDPDANNKSLIKSWLDTCFQDHVGHCRSPHDKKFLKMIKMPFFGVIDVFNLCLTKLPTSEDSRDIDSGESKLDMKGFPYQEEGAQHAPYAALSYVWGGDQIHKTTTAKILHLRGPGSLEKVLSDYPQVIKDAIDLTRRLGIRYLWVDSCCIVQDSERVWKRNAQHMDMIYGNAAVTICAADGSTAHDGLHALQTDKRSKDQHIRRVAPGVRLMVSHLAETAIKTTTWNKRAWTFQERLLSKRCLIFAEGRVFFQCPSSTMLEDIIAEPRGRGWSLDLVNVPSQLTRDLKSRPFFVYTQCIGLYSARQLTKEEDILAAFTGVENMLSRYLNGPLAFGLPTSHFDLALLWDSISPAKRRWVTEGKQDELSRKRSEFPSWSWCGWSDAKMVYKTELMQDVEGDVHSWLTEHTWIKWYIRDGNGYLRPLWKSSDIGSTKEHLQTDARWVGYTEGRRERRHDRSRDSSHERPRSRSRSAELHERRHRRRGSGASIASRERANDTSAQEDNFFHRDTYGRNYYHTVGDVQRNVQEDAQPQDTYHTVYYERPADDPYYPRPPQNPYNHEPHQQRPGVAAHIYSPGRREVEREYYPPRPRYSSPPANRERDIIIYRRGRNEPDDYGRVDHSSSMRGGLCDDFYITIPESPYTVKTAPYRRKPDKEFPDYPILQFWTWSAHLRIAKSRRHDTDQQDPTKLHQYDIHDEAGDWCGTILLDPQWVSGWEVVNGESIEGSKHEFLALSDAKRFTDKECETWTYYIPKERTQSEWDLYYVLLVSRNQLFWQRVALGKVFKTALDNGEPRKMWKEIVLA